MSASISNDIILDAAEAIVCESGAARMTLDGVAERAQISKGGLMYRFPSKTALLQGMIGRMIEKMNDLREQARQEFGETEPNELMIEIKILSKMGKLGSKTSAAMLAVLANQPELMEPFHEEICTRFSNNIFSEDNPERATIIFLAALGLKFSTMLNVPLFDQKQREKTYELLMHLAAHKEEQL